MLCPNCNHDCAAATREAAAEGGVIWGCGCCAFEAFIPLAPDDRARSHEIWKSM